MSDFLTMHLVIFGVHWVPLLMAACIWPHKAMRWRVSGVLNMVCTLLAGFVVLVCALALMDAENRSGHGTSGTFYLIYAVVSLGIVPAVLIAIHTYFGRFVGWAARAVIIGLPNAPTKAMPQK